MESQGQDLDPDEERSREELDTLSSRFREAMEEVRKARFKSDRGNVSLYQLPWYIIIGPPGSGKTTALVNSGLEFPLAQTHGKEALGGVDRALPFPPEAMRVARGKSGGVQKVALPDGYLDDLDDATPPGPAAEAADSGG